MGWRNLTPTAVIVGWESYTEAREHDGEEQMRARVRVTKEYRGLTESRAKILCTPSGAMQYGNGSITYSATPIGAGGWTVMEVWDFASTSWAKGDVQGTLDEGTLFGTSPVT